MDAVRDDVHVRMIAVRMRGHNNLMLIEPQAPQKPFCHIRHGVVARTIGRIPGHNKVIDWRLRAAPRRTAPHHARDALRVVNDPHPPLKEKRTFFFPST